MALYNKLLNKLVKNAMIGKDVSKLSASNPTQEETEKILDTLIYKILYRFSAALTQTDMMQIEKLKDTNNETEEINKFLHGKIPNFDAIIEEEIEIFKNKTS